jgi:hypothetical protein
VGIALAAAVLLDLVLLRRWRSLVMSSAAAALMVLPWLMWLAGVRGGTQLGLLEVASLPRRLGSQVLCCIQRVPDQITGPFVEVGTVFAPRWGIVATSWAVLGTAILALGWVRLARVPGLRLGALVPATTLVLLCLWPFTEAGRFLVPAIPWILLGALEGLATLLFWVRHGIGWQRIPARLIAAWLVLAASLPYSLYQLVSAPWRSEQALHAGFDAACRYIDLVDTRPGPILTRYPAELFWQTGREAVSPPEPATDALLDEVIEAQGVPYLVVEGERFARAGNDPLEAYAAAHPERIREKWRGPGSTRIYEVMP